MSRPVKSKRAPTSNHRLGGRRSGFQPRLPPPAPHAVTILGFAPEGKGTPIQYLLTVAPMRPKAVTRRVTTDNPERPALASRARAWGRGTRLAAHPGGCSLHARVALPAHGPVNACHLYRYFPSRAPGHLTR